jgi:hypothetical protein
MRSLFRTIMGLGLLALIAGPAAAQQGRGFGFGGGGNLATLAANTGVQKELKLDDQQVEKAKDLAEKTREKMRETRETLQGLEGEERRTKQQEISREMNASSLKALGEFLKPEQIARLKQISYQVRGAQAFSDPEVSQKLNLTDGQKTDIQTIVKDSQGQMPSREDFQNDREAAMKKAQEVGKQTLSQAAAKLNDEQQKTWKELLGAPFEYKPDPPAQ